VGFGGGGGVFFSESLWVFIKKKFFPPFVPSPRGKKRGETVGGVGGGGGEGLYSGMEVMGGVKET